MERKQEKPQTFHSQHSPPPNEYEDQQQQYQQGPTAGIASLPMFNIQSQLVWAPRPPPLMGYPPGLELLANIDRLVISEEVKLHSDLNSAGIKYMIKDASERLVFQGVEDILSPYRRGQLGLRGFSIGVFDSAGQEVMRLVKQPTEIGTADLFCACFNNPFLMELLVECPPGNELGRIKQKTGCMQLGMIYQVIDRNRTVQLNINGSPVMNAGTEVEFQLLTADKAHSVGKIVKLFSGVFQETFTSADNFVMHFPSDLDVKVKALLIGGTVLVDFSQFQSIPPAERRAHYHYPQ